jgi:hypothetical protein
MAAPGSFVNDTPMRAGHLSRHRRLSYRQAIALFALASGSLPRFFPLSLPTETNPPIIPAADDLTKLTMPQSIFPVSALRNATPLVLIGVNPLGYRPTGRYV